MHHKGWTSLYWCNKFSPAGTIHDTWHYYIHHCGLICLVWAAAWVCVILGGNGQAGFSQCISLPAPVPFQYSGNLRSSREGLADTTQQPADGRGMKLRKWERQRHWDTKSKAETNKTERRGLGAPEWEGAEQGQQINLVKKRKHSEQRRDTWFMGDGKAAVV